MALKVTLIFQITTQPTDPTAAIAHSGGWSESWWYRSSAFLTPVSLSQFIQRRAALLPVGCAVIGVRQGLYTLSGNKILPQGTSAFKQLFPGSTTRTAGLPQDALEMSGVASGAINANRFTLRAMPDGVIQFGEYQPDPQFKALVTLYRAAILGNLAASPLNAFGFIGRDLTQPSAAVNSIAANVVTLRANVGGVAGTDFLRFHRCYDDGRKPVKGSFLITNIAGNVYTLANPFNRTLSNPSGTARIDRVTQFDFTDVQPVRAVTRKIGRPSQGYRGRQSKKTAA